MQKSILYSVALAGLLCLLPATANGDVIFQESFESDPGTTYTFSDTFDDTGFDFFGRYAVPDNTNFARDDFQLGWDGSFGVMGQDHDADGFAATQSINIFGIDVSSATEGISTSILFGALNSEPDFNNYEAADGDGIRVFAQLDGGGFNLIGEFAANNTGASDLYLDTDSDGIGDGTRLTTTMTSFAFDVAGTGSTLDLRIDLTSTSSFEPLAVDNVRVSAVPEPGVTSVAALALIGLIARRRTR